MSEPKLISPMLDNFDMGDPISQHDGIRCCPAMKKESDEKYIVNLWKNIKRLFGYKERIVN